MVVLKRKTFPYDEHQKTMGNGIFRCPPHRPQRAGFQKMGRQQPSRYL